MMTPRRTQCLNSSCTLTSLLVSSSYQQPPPLIEEVLSSQWLACQSSISLTLAIVEYFSWNHDASSLVCWGAIILLLKLSNRLGQHDTFQLSSQSLPSSSQFSKPAGQSACPTGDASRQQQYYYQACVSSSWYHIRSENDKSILVTQTISIKSL